MQRASEILGAIVLIAIAVGTDWATVEAVRVNPAGVLLVGAACLITSFCGIVIYLCLAGD